jgi:glycosyltransferase involved in cell wall biosynthesis
MARRILHLDSGRDWRGGQRQILFLVRGLRDAGIEGLVVAHPGSPLLRRLRLAGVASASVHMRADWDLMAVRRVRRIIRTWRPDLVHAHDARSHAIALSALAGITSRPRPPLVVTRRVTFVPRGRIKYGTRVARFIAISKSVRDALVRGGVNAARIDIVYSGVPTPAANHRRDWRTECRWPADVVVGGIVGAMTSEKGLTSLEAIMQALPAASRNRLRLVLLGGAFGGIVPLGGVEAFRAGFVDEVHDAVAGLDFLLHPSRAEGLGTAVIDAMALRVPPVAFAVGGLRELIEDGRNGVLVPAGDVQAFADAVERVIVDPSWRDALAAAGPERAARFGVDQMVDGTRAVYDRLLAP